MMTQQAPEKCSSKAFACHWEIGRLIHSNISAIKSTYALQKEGHISFSVVNQSATTQSLANCDVYIHYELYVEQSYFLLM